ncbi:lipoprotein insertase outer membrane protein LolB [Pseudomonas sp. 5P_3.1_Bac2]|uniref:lipoprotein insertase outer membrane protein LolB n=1 Tax=Pseudomonas sp. 5P_3.1_Bac2 TaxID=2971617 RepID=UPI0021C65E57|nr:lipoprotein insertase outer membrane protein LolB [Pseudomonas sp. 5P_3.1_Bac2]MCU1716352.1 lipoprotein insertase outer membrane protein LolB [Pseudomonas sp. 5P_3.1_Bac2]
MKYLRHLILCGLLATLAGCAGFGTHESLEGQGNSQTWKEHKAQLSKLDAWQINGKVGIRAPQDSGSGTLFWLQRQDYYDIRLSGPLGRGAARLMGHPGKITLEVANQGRYEAQSPEQLLHEQLHLNLPVSHLLWWIRGLPSPDSKSRLNLDSHSRLAGLSQDGWQIEYLSYTEQNGYWLPERLKVSGEDLQITLVIKDWQPRQLGQ